MRLALVTPDNPLAALLQQAPLRRARPRPDSKWSADITHCFPQLFTRSKSSYPLRQSHWATRGMCSNKRRRARLSSQSAIPRSATLVFLLLRQTGDSPAGVFCSLEQAEMQCDRCPETVRLAALLGGACRGTEHGPETLLEAICEVLEVEGERFYRVNDARVRGAPNT